MEECRLLSRLGIYENNVLGKVVQQENAEQSGAAMTTKGLICFGPQLGRQLQKRGREISKALQKTPIFIAGC